MTSAKQPAQEAPDEFVALVNRQGQRALWPAGLKLPRGWRRESDVLPRSECLAAVAAAWPDVTPASVAAAPAARQAGGHRGSRVRRDSRAPFAHELVARQAALRPEATAVIAGRTSLTYGELAESAGRLAHYLGELGVGPETVVGVHLDRGADLIRAMLAVMLAGGAYLPLDPALPAERLTRVCSQVRPALVLAERADGVADGARVIPVGALDAELAGRPAARDDARPHPDSLCYVIYTSGSTGDPKPVAVSYASLAAVIGDITREYQITPDDRVAQVASIGFDTSIEQVLAALAGGATLVLPPPGTMAPSDLLRGIERKRVTVIDLTPAYWHQLLALTQPGDERLRSVRLMITGGEAADPGDCRAALRAAPWARLLNAYGLTETTITSAVHDVGAAGAEAKVPDSVPVGRAVGPARLMVLDERLSPVPSGQTGEIYIGGSGVARGYLGRPELTAERFLPDPGGEPGSRMYRTGDLGRMLPDGSLEVAGRADRQLKVRGFRVEPGEIESALAAHPDIDQVSVVATRRSSGDTRLVAYYTPRQATSAHPPSASLRRYLLDQLPGYMIPSAFIARQNLPSEAEQSASGAEQSWSGSDQARSASGQSPSQAEQGERDRDERPGAQRPGQEGEQPAAVPRPRDKQRLSPGQTGLAALWARLLQQEHVGLDDDFFDLGGNSLLAAEMLAHTRAIFGIPADSARQLTRSLLREPTLRAFAAAVRDARAGRLGLDGDQQETDFAAEARLEEKIPPPDPSLPPPDWRSPGRILLTGATGFLGSHLLRELLATTGARVWCLVRARDAADARTRIARAAARYELPAPPDDRVVPLPGDLAEPLLGLSGEAFDDLARGTDVIYHPGALVNFIYPYQELRAANVTGTRELIRLAAQYRGIPVHFVSTTAVLAGLGVSGVHKATEETALAHPELLRMGYVETKYVAEEMLRNAAREGLPVAIYRPLDIVGSEQTGAWNTSTEMCALIRFITDTGLAPDIDLPLDFVAADVCAAAIRHISLTGPGTGRTYHLASSSQAPLVTLVARLRERGYQITEIPFGDWSRKLAHQAASDPSHPMAAFLPLFLDRDRVTGLTVAEMYLQHVFPAYTRTHTERALRGSGIEFPPVIQLLDRNIDRLMATGYLAAPSAGGGAGNAR